MTLTCNSGSFTVRSAAINVSWSGIGQLLVWRL
jgi:hypothetical protein